MVLDTTILVYAVGADHPFAAPCRRLIEAVGDGFTLFQRHKDLGAFDAVLVAASMDGGADGLVSADSAFASVPGLTHIHPSSEALHK